MVPCRSDPTLEWIDQTRSLPSLGAGLHRATSIALEVGKLRAFATGMFIYEYPTINQLTQYWKCRVGINGQCDDSVMATCTAPKGAPFIRLYDPATQHASRAWSAAEWAVRPPFTIFRSGQAGGGPVRGAAIRLRCADRIRRFRQMREQGNTFTEQL